MAVYNLAFVYILIAVVRVSTDVNPDTSFGFDCMAGVLTGGGTLVLLFGPKFLMIYNGEPARAFIVALRQVCNIYKSCNCSL